MMHQTPAKHLLYRLNIGVKYNRLIIILMIIIIIIMMMMVIIIIIII